MNNEQKIKKMTTCELAEFIYKVSSNSTKITTCTDLCKDCDYSESYCISNIGEWLHEEVTNDIG